MLGTYLVFPWVSVSGIAIFTLAFLDVTGLAPGADWIIPALAGWALIWWLAARGIRPTTRSLLVFEAVAVLLILALMVLVFVRLGSRSGPRGQTFTAGVLQLLPSAGAGTVALAATVGFLAFAGFESAGSLGEEAHRPARSIPRAMLVAIALGGVFYVACILAQSWGFGTDKAGVAAFAGSSAPLGELAREYGVCRLTDGGGAGPRRGDQRDRCRAGLCGGGGADALRAG
jgi:amino acid transporter